MGQAPVKRYNDYLRDLILAGVGPAELHRQPPSPSGSGPGGLREVRPARRGLHQDPAQAAVAGRLTGGAGKSGEMTCCVPTRGQGLRLGVAPSISLEQETKFAVRPAFELPDLRKVVGRSVRQPERSFRTAYFDTPDLRLRDRNITLRYRAGVAHRSGTWTVKLPEDDGGATLDRREISWPGTEAKVPAEARALLLGLVRRAPLDQVAEMQTTRLSWMLHGQDDAPWAELDYDDVTVIGGRRDGLRYRQVEIERTGEAMDDQAMAAIKEEVRRAGAEPDDQPKLAKALGPSGTETSEREIGAGRNSTAAGVVRHAIRDALERLLDHDYRLRLRPDSPQQR